MSAQSDASQPQSNTSQPSPSSSLSLKRTHEADTTDKVNKVAKTSHDAVVPHLRPVDVNVLEPSLFGFRQVDDTLSVLIKALVPHLNKENLEIEVKFGLLLDKETKQRVRFPVLSETVLDTFNIKGTIFESNMPLEWHKYFNEILNRRVVETQKPDYKGYSIEFKHIREHDRFYITDDLRVRASVDPKTNEIVPGSIIQKKRLVDLNVHLPNCPFDFRISLNSENPIAKLPKRDWDHERRKDRATYKHQHCRVDLTQVKGQKDVGITHELELELWDIEALRREYRRHQEQKPSNFIPLLKVFLDNARVLARLPASMPAQK